MRLTTLLVVLTATVALFAATTLMIVDAVSVEDQQLESFLANLMEDALEDEDFAEYLAEINLVPQSDAEYIYGYKCHSLGNSFTGNWGSSENCRSECNRMEAAFVNGVERMNYVPRGQFSIGFCSCCGSIR